MNKTKRYIQILGLILLLCAVISGIFLANVNQSLNSSGECDMTLSACTLAVMNDEISVKFEQRPVQEEELFIRFDLPAQFSIEKAWIEGVNMYMGKTPVMFEDDTQLDQGVTFLGSCNLETMEWVMHLNIKSNDTQEVSSVRLSFFTVNE